jgi:hypothetical protein
MNIKKTKIIAPPTDDKKTDEISETIPDDEPIPESKTPESAPTDSINWGVIQTTFDEIRNVNLKFAFLRELVDRLKICHSAECKIFPELHQLDLQRWTFEEYGVFSIPEAKEKLTNKIEYFKWLEDYKKFIIDCKEIFSKIYALKIAKDTSQINLKVRHEHMYRVLEIMSHGPGWDADVKKSVQKELDETLDDTKASLPLDDPDIQKAAHQFQSEISKAGGSKT